MFNILLGFEILMAGCHSGDFRLRYVQLAEFYRSVRGSCYLRHQSS
jgi:hypothetical protein